MEKRNTLRSLAMKAVLAGSILIIGAGGNVYASGFINGGGRSDDGGGAMGTGHRTTSSATSGTMITSGGRSDDGGGALGSGHVYSMTSDDNGGFGGSGNNSIANDGSIFDYLLRLFY